MLVEPQGSWSATTKENSTPAKRDRVAITRIAKGESTIAGPKRVCRLLNLFRFCPATPHEVIANRNFLTQEELVPEDRYRFVVQFAVD